MALPFAYRAESEATRVGLEPTYTGLKSMYSKTAVRMSFCKMTDEGLESETLRRSPLELRR